MNSLNAASALFQSNSSTFSRQLLSSSASRSADKTPAGKVGFACTATSISDQLRASAGARSRKSRTRTSLSARCVRMMRLASSISGRAGTEIKRLFQAAAGAASGLVPPGQSVRSGRNRPAESAPRRTRCGHACRGRRTLRTAIRPAIRCNHWSPGGNR